MIIGVPRERKTLEKRVAITPDGAERLIQLKHKVLIETNAGVGSFFNDDAYRAVGCHIVPTLGDVWNESELVVKVKEPDESEFEFFRPRLALFDYLHLASAPEVSKALVDNGITGIAYELVQGPNGRLPLLEPMSEVAGKLSVLNGSYFLLSQNGGRGVLLGGAIGVPRGKVVIIGAGIAGQNACEVAVGMGAAVTVLDVEQKKLERLTARFGKQISTVHSTSSSIARECKDADLVIGAVLIPGAAAPRIVTREIIRSMPERSVFVDISIDQGGCAETIRTTSLQDPVYIEENVLHYGVPNMPAQTARTSTMALTAATLPYIIKIANAGVEEILRSDNEVRNALNTYRGKLTNEAVAEAVGLEYTPIQHALRLD